MCTVKLRHVALQVEGTARILLVVTLACRVIAAKRRVAERTLSLWWVFAERHVAMEAACALSFESSIAEAGHAGLGAPDYLFPDPHILQFAFSILVA